MALDPAQVPSEQTPLWEAFHLMTSLLGSTLVPFLRASN